MSHYSVLVIGKDPEKQLAPYHEFECTGTDDEYVQDIDQTASLKKEYDSSKKRMYRDPHDELHDPYDRQFYRDPTPEETKKIGPIAGSGGGHGLSWHSEDWGDGRGYRTRIHFLPKGWKEVQVKRSSTQSFRDFVCDYHGKPAVQFGERPDLAKAHKYGYALLNEKGNVAKVIDRTNPNRKWDWHQLGGRWNGYFKLNTDDGGEPVWSKGITGQPGLNKTDEGYEPPGFDRADQCLKRDVDFQGMREEAVMKAGEKYDLAYRILGEHPKHKSWKTLYTLHKEKARDIYHRQAAVKALRENKETMWLEADEFLVSRKQYVQEAFDRAISTFAVVKDGKWYAKGEMGWWGTVRKGQSESSWNKKFNELLDSLPDDTLLSVYDCHI